MNIFYIICCSLYFIITICFVYKLENIINNNLIEDIVLQKRSSLIILISLLWPLLFCVISYYFVLSIFKKIYLRFKRKEE